MTKTPEQLYAELEVERERVKILQKLVEEYKATLKVNARDTMSVSNELDEWRKRALEAEGMLASCPTCGGSS